MGQTKEICTLYGESMDPEHVLEEYPRPQMVRENYCILNGWWRYAIVDRKSVFPSEMQGEILVPFSPETKASGVGRMLHPDEKLCYEKIINIVDVPAQKRLLLHFGAVDQKCKVFVNKKMVGNHDNGYLPFTLDITGVVKRGENVLQLEVLDDTGKNGESHGKQSLNPKGMFYPAQSGIWQSVWYEWVENDYVTDVRLFPDLDKRQVEIGLICKKSEFEIEKNVHVKAEVRAGEACVGNYEGTEKWFCISLSEIHCWEPDSPYLYQVEIEYGKDWFVTYFGLRSLTVEKDEKGIPRLCLNHRFLFQNGVLDQGYWPESLYTPPSEQAMIDDILAMKGAGFNMIRKHCKIEPSRWYYHCDRLGMLVWQDMVNGGTYNPLWDSYFPMLVPHFLEKAKEHRILSGRFSEMRRKAWRRQLEGTIRLLANHPSVVTWVLFNEGWGQFDTEENTEYARRLDGTRFIDQASGWFDHKGGDIKSVHNYYQVLTCPQDDSGRAKVISEYGGIALVVPEHQSFEKPFGYRTLESFAKYQKRFKELMQKIVELKDAGLSASVYTQLSDVENEVNGVLTYDRKCNKLKEEDYGKK